MGERAGTATLRATQLPTLAPGVLASLRRAAGRQAIFPLMQPLIVSGELLPRRANAALWAGTAAAIDLLVPRFRETAVDNIVAVYGDAISQSKARRLAAESVRSFARSMADVPRLHRCSKRELLAMVEIRGFEKIEAALSRGRGIVGIAPHMGNWELLACALAARGVPIAAVAAALHDPRLGAYLASLRARWGVRTIVKNGHCSTREALTVLRRGEMLGTLGDLHTRGDAISAPFLGRMSRVPAGPVRLALRTNAALLPMCIVRGPAGRYAAEVLDPIPLGGSGSRESDVASGVRRVAEALGSFVLRRPVEWLWVHDRWPSRRGRA